MSDKDSYSFGKRVVSKERILNLSYFYAPKMVVAPSLVLVFTVLWFF